MSNDRASRQAAASAPPPSPRSFTSFSEITSFLWGVADLLRGDYKQADYGKVILPLTVLRRIDCVLEPTKAKVLKKHEELKAAKHPEGTVEKMLVRITGVPFYNTSKLDFPKRRRVQCHLLGAVREADVRRDPRHSRQPAPGVGLGTSIPGARQGENALRRRSLASKRGAGGRRG